jgi:hypothetical protein
LPGFPLATVCRWEWDDGDWRDFGFNKTFDQGMQMPEATSVHAMPFNYYSWLERGKEICAGHDRNQWRIGDWLAEGKNDFDACDATQTFKEMPSHMRISRPHRGAHGELHCKSIPAPNFWRDASSETNVPTQTLKNLCRVALFFPPEKRFKQLSFTHHATAAGYDRASEYLQACLEFTELEREEGSAKRPRSVAWLEALIEKQEGRNAITGADESFKIVRFMVPAATYQKLRDLSLHYRTKIGELVGNACNAAVDAYLEEMARKITMQWNGGYDENQPCPWPFTHGAQKPAKPKKTRRTPRMTHNKKQRARLKHTAVSIRKIRRNDLVNA